MIDAGVSADGAEDSRSSALANLALLDLGYVGVRVGSTHARNRDTTEVAGDTQSSNPRSGTAAGSLRGKEAKEAHRYFTMRANPSGSRLAPPTSAPSISGCAMNSLMFPGLTLPPY